MKHVKSGDIVRAQTINGLMDAVQKNIALDGGAAGLNVPAITVMASNIDTVNFSIGSVAIIRGQATIEKSGAIVNILEIAKATVTDDVTALCVCNETIAVGATGEVAISGLVWAKCDGGTGGYGILAPGNDFLTIGAAGSVQVFSSADGFALCRFPTGAGGSGSIVVESHVTQSLGFCSDAG